MLVKKLTKMLKNGMVLFFTWNQNHESLLHQYTVWILKNTFMSHDPILLLQCSGIWVGLGINCCHRVLLCITQPLVIFFLIKNDNKNIFTSIIVYT